MADGKRKGKRAIIIILCVLLGLVLLFSVTSVIVCGIIYSGQFGRSDTPDWSTKYGVNFEKMEALGYVAEKVSVPSGKLHLTGYLYGAELDAPKGLVVFCHGLGGGTELYVAEICGLVDRGWQVLGVDFRGSFSSEGEDVHGLPQSVYDLNNILTWVEGQTRFDGMDVVLFGHSWGGYAVTSMLNYGKHDVKAVVAASAIYDAYGFIGRQTIGMLGGFGYVEYPFGCIYQWLLYGRAAGFNGVDGINKANIPVMIVQGTHDSTINGADALTYYKDKITNPNVIWVEPDGAGRGTHNYILRSEDAYAYICEVDAAYDALKAEHPEGLTYEQKVAFYQSVDDQRISEIDKDFWDSVDLFFTEAIAK